jgi:hypothetical protein
LSTNDQVTKNRRKLPHLLQICFWDYDFSALSWEKDRDFIIGRVLSYGNWDAVIWLRSRLEDHALREWIMHHQGRGLSPRQLRFWQLILGLSHREVNSWLELQPRSFWGRRVRP